MAPRLIRWFRFRIAVVRQLNDAERKVTLTPAFTPGFDHGGEQHAILLGACFVRLALIPERTANREWNERGDHTVVDGRGDTVLAKCVGNGRRRLRTCTLGFGLVGGCAPLFEL